MFILYSCDYYTIMIITDLLFFFFFFNDTATTEIYTLSLHDALPILGHIVGQGGIHPDPEKIKKIKDFPIPTNLTQLRGALDRKSTRLNSSHMSISYAVFCLKKKKKNKKSTYKIHKTIKK